MDEALSIALEVGCVLDRLGVRWFLGGSLASSLRGIPRATLDADIVADIRATHVRPLIDALGDAWYADEEATRDAVARRGSFNVIHYQTAVKVDVFVPKLRRFDSGQFSRASRTPVSLSQGTELPVCVAEDIVVAKLEWYRMGGESSERQWGDIVGVLRLNAGSLDLALLRESAEELGVTDLLHRAFAESGLAG